MTTLRAEIPFPEQIGLSQPLTIILPRRLNDALYVQLQTICDGQSQKLKANAGIAIKFEEVPNYPGLRERLNELAQVPRHRVTVTRQKTEFVLTHCDPPIDDGKPGGQTMADVIAEMRQVEKVTNPSTSETATMTTGATGHIPKPGKQPARGLSAEDRAKLNGTQAKDPADGAAQVLKKKYNYGR